MVTSSVLKSTEVEELAMRKSAAGLPLTVRVSFSDPRFFCSLLNSNRFLS